MSSLDSSQVELILNDIRAITENVIIKMSAQAEQYETVESKREGDKYVSAMLERDIFASYRSYPIDVLVNAGINDANLLMEYSKDKYKKSPEIVISKVFKTITNKLKDFKNIDNIFIYLNTFINSENNS